MTDMREWQSGVGRTWAENWQLTDRSFSGLTSQFLEKLAALPGREVLDIGCGAGELSLAIARQRPDARVTGVDVSSDLIATALERAGDHPAAEFLLGDAASWQSSRKPDLLVSRHGVMFFDEPSAAFEHLRTISAPTSRLAFTCFRSPEENTWMSGLASLVPGGAPARDPTAPGPFAFADPHRVRAILESAGWSGVRIEPLDFAYIAGAGADPVSDAIAFFQRIGPLAPMLRSAEGDMRQLLMDRLRQWISRHLNGDMVLFAAAAWRVTARSD